MVNRFRAREISGREVVVIICAWCIFIPYRIDVLYLCLCVHTPPLLSCMLCPHLDCLAQDSSLALTIYSFFWLFPSATSKRTRYSRWCIYLSLVIRTRILDSSFSSLCATQDSKNSSNFFFSVHRRTRKAQISFPFFVDIAYLFCCLRSVFHCIVKSLRQGRAKFLLPPCYRCLYRSTMWFAGFVLCILVTFLVSLRLTKTMHDTLHDSPCSRHHCLTLTNMHLSYPLCHTSWRSLTLWLVDHGNAACSHFTLFCRLSDQVEEERWNVFFLYQIVWLSTSVYHFYLPRYFVVKIG